MNELEQIKDRIAKAEGEEKAALERQFNVRISILEEQAKAKNQIPDAASKLGTGKTL